jgi:hypothetical protein
MPFAGTYQCTTEEMALSQEEWRELVLLCASEFCGTKNHRPLLSAAVGHSPWAWAKEAYWKFAKMFSRRDYNG